MWCLIRNRPDYTHASVTTVSRDSKTHIFTLLWDIFILLFLTFVLLLLLFLFFAQKVRSQGRQELLITPKLYGLAWIRCLQTKSGEMDVVVEVGVGRGGCRADILSGCGLWGGLRPTAPDVEGKDRKNVECLEVLPNHLEVLPDHLRVPKPWFLALSECLNHLRSFLNTWSKVLCVLSWESPGELLKFVTFSDLLRPIQSFSRVGGGRNPGLGLNSPRIF